jgi:hypothetical protein
MGIELFLSLSKNILVAHGRGDGTLSVKRGWVEGMKFYHEEVTASSFYLQSFIFKLIGFNDLSHRSFEAESLIK